MTRSSCHNLLGLNVTGHLTFSNYSCHHAVEQLSFQFLPSAGNGKKTVKIVKLFTARFVGHPERDAAVEFFKCNFLDALIFAHVAPLVLTSDSNRNTNFYLGSGSGMP